MTGPLESRLIAIAMISQTGELMATRRQAKKKSSGRLRRSLYTFLSSANRACRGGGSFTKVELTQRAKSGQRFVA